MWEELLRDKEFEPIRAATIRYLHTNAAFAPTPGQLIQSAAEHAQIEAREREEREFARKRIDFAGGHLPDVSDETRQKNLQVIRTWLKSISQKATP